jgi:hypothetical protein
MRAPQIARAVAGFTLFTVAPAAAQNNPPPPPFINIFREVLKTGHAGPHVATEAGWPRAFAAANTQNHYLAISTLFGGNEVWFLEGHASVAEIEAVNKNINDAPGLSAELDRLSLADAEHVESVRTLLARYLPAASNPGNVSLPAMRVWELVIFRVRPGQEADFFEAASLYKSVVEQARQDAPWATYQVIAGMPGPTYLVFAPHRTLAEIDPNTGAGAAIEAAMTEETMQRFSTLSSGMISVETLVFVTSPEMSYLSPEWIAQDSAYWGRKAPTR